MAFASLRSAITRLGWLALISLTLGGLVPGTPARAAPLAAPSLGIIPGSGPAGQAVSATGSGWTASNGPYKIFWQFKGGSELGTFNPSGSGSWSAPITIPGGASAGPHTIVACEGYGGEFEQCASASYTVVPPTPTITPTRTRTPTPPPGTTPSFILTPTFTTTPTSTSGCIDGITRISPDFTDQGGVASIDLIMEVTIGDPATRVLIHTQTSRSGAPEYFTQWPDPYPGTTVDAVPSPVDPNRFTLTVRDYPTRLGYNQIQVELSPTCWRQRSTYYQFGNGTPPTPTPRPDACGGLGLPADAVVIDFERLYTESSYQQLARDFGIRFEGSVEREAAEGYLPRSGSYVGTSVDAMEFGSAMQPIRMAFDRPLSALGVFVGMEDAVWVSGEVTAVLDVFGYRGGSGGLVRLGADSTTFPAGPTDVIHCLRYSAEPGDLIARAHVEYTDATGNSIAERRVIDDLTLVLTEEALPPDLAPIVEITTPGDGAFHTASTIFLRAEIREDRELIRAAFQIDGGAETAIGVAPLISDPTAYFTGINLGASLLRDGLPHTLSVTAWDSAGQFGTDTVTITGPTPVPTIDLQAVKMEVVQVIQCLHNYYGCPDNAVPMLIGKPTWVRLYVTAEGGPPARPVSGRLCRGRVARCDSGMVLPINRISPDDDLRERMLLSDRDDLSASLNFIVPPAWLNEGTLELTAFVNYDEEDLDETRYDNNATQASVSVVRPRRLTVMFKPVTADGVTAPLSEMWSFVDWLTRVFPVARITPIGLPPLRGDFDLSDSSGDGCGRSWGRLMDALRSAYSWSGPGRAHLYGLVPEEAERDGVGGCGETPGRVASGQTSVGSRVGAVIAAQELGHNFDRHHAPGCDAGNVDDDYPRRGGALDDYGIDLALRQVYPKDTSFDYMGYCGGADNTWTSVYTYLRVMRTLPVAAEGSSGGHLAAPFRADGEVKLIGGGTISPQGFTLERGFYRAALADGVEDGLPEGPFSVQLRDLGGGILFSRDFNVIELSNHEHVDAGHFQIILPDLPETAEIVFLYDGAEIGRVTASDGAPEVAIVEPVGGEDWGASGAHTIAWQASDPDGDPLRFNVQYSIDGGASWEAIDLDVETTSLELDSADLPGGGLLFRVLASDGLNTAVSATTAPVTVGNKPPLMHLASPVDGDWIPAGEAAVFRGYATDYEDVIVEDDAFRWTSSLDGDLGRGPNLWGLPLSVGEHRITLTVTDRDGQTASQSVTIRIGEEAEGAPRRPLGLLVAVLLLGGGLLVAAALGGIVYVMRRGGSGAR